MADVLKSIEKIVANNKELTSELALRRDQVGQLQSQVSDHVITYQRLNMDLNKAREELAKVVSERDDFVLNRVGQLEERNQFLSSELERARINSGKTKVSKRVHNEIIMARRLRQMGIDYELIRPIFEVDNTVLSGGLVVQTMLGEFWQTDLDIFTTDAEAVIEALQQAHPYWTEDIKELSKHMAAQYSTEYKARVWRGEFVKGVIVEVIEVRSIESAIKGFDLDFCKCYFDGRNFHTYNVEALMTKTHKGRHSIKNNRTRKYEMRGFMILQPLVEDPDMPPRLLESDSDDESLEHAEGPPRLVDLDEIPKKFLPYMEQLLGLIRASQQLSIAADRENDNIDESRNKFWCDDCKNFHDL